MRIRRAALRVLITLGLVALASCGSTVDSTVVGAWTALIPTPGGMLTATIVIDEDGGYITTFVGFPPLAPERGELEARDGEFRRETDTGTVDSGTYVLSTPNTWVTTGAAGTIIWQRAGTLPTFDGAPPVLPSMPGVATPTAPALTENTWPLEGVPDMAKAALATARAWHSDAILRGVSAELVASHAGVLGNITTPAGQVQLHIMACSPSVQRAKVIAPGGHDFPEQPTDDCDATRPLPDFPDFPAAVALAQARGMTSTQPQSIAIEDYKHRGVPGEDLTDWAWRIVPPLHARDQVQVFALNPSVETVRAVDACAVIAQRDAEQAMAVSLAPGPPPATSGNRTWACAYQSPGSNAAGMRIQIDESPFRDKRGVMAMAARNQQTPIAGLGDEAYFQLPGSGVASLTILLGDTLIELGLWGGRDPAKAIQSLGRLAVTRVVEGQGVVSRASLADQLVGSWNTQLYDRALMLTVRADHSVNLQMAGEIVGVLSTEGSRFDYMTRARRPLFEGGFDVPRSGRLVTSGVLTAQWRSTRAPVQIHPSLITPGALADRATDAGPWPQVPIDPRLVGLWETIGSYEGRDARMLWRIRNGGPSQLIWALSGNGYLETPRATYDRVIIHLADQLVSDSRSIGSRIDNDLIIEQLAANDRFETPDWSGFRGNLTWRRQP